MSRTKKGQRGIGYEYWSKRPLSRNHGAEPGRVTKDITHRKERAEGKREILKAPLEPEYDPREYSCDDEVCTCQPDDYDESGG